MIRILTLVLCLMSLLSIGQTYHGLMPVVQIKKKLPNNWDLNFQAENRNGVFNDSENLFTQDLFNTTFITNKKLGINHRIGVGANLRFNAEFKVRLVQQYTFIRRYERFRMAHRFSSDQQLGDGIELLRFRYRITAELPLNGWEVDPKEGYFKFNHEQLLGFQNNSQRLEARINPMLGYLFQDKTKIEYGVDFRIRDTLTSFTRNNLWYRVTAYFVLD